MAEAEGKCPGCDGTGQIGDECPEKGCTKRGYHYIPKSFWERAHPEEDANPDPVIGQLVGDFLAVAKIGAGGFGKVFLALQSPLFRLKGALKLIEFPSENVMLTQALLEKFQGEAEALADLTHPNIVRLLKYGTHKQQPYLVMEFVDQGQTLRQEIQERARAKGGFEHSELHTIFDQVLNGLAAAHEQNIIHRDVKPENVMLQSVVGNPFHVRILDFGTAKFVENRADTKWPLGSPSYMAPEQVNLKGIGPWSDLYAVAVMIFELLTGRRPFPGSTENEIVANKMDESFDPLHALDRFDFPDVVHRFLEKGLQTDPEQRFRDAEEFRLAMAEVFEALSEHPGTFGAQGVELTALLDSGDLIDVDQDATTRQASPPPVEDIEHSNEGEPESSESSETSDPPAALERKDAGETAELAATDPEVTARGEKPSRSRAPYVVVVALLIAVVVAGLYYFRQAEAEKANTAVVAASTLASNSSESGEIEARREASKLASFDEAGRTIQSALTAAPVAPTNAEPQRLIQKVVAGKFHTCVLVEKRVRCWGANFEGELGLGREGAIGDDEPAWRSDWIEFDSPIVDVTAAGDRQASFTCVLLDSGAVRCWGANDHGQLGLGHTNQVGKETPVSSVPAISLGGKATQIAAGASKFASHVCALMESGELRCWGGNNYGQLGLANKTDVGDDEIPVAVAPVSVGVEPHRVYAGKYHTCALTEAGAARCWGWNSEGQLGLGHTRDIGDDESPSVSGNIPLAGVKLTQLALGRRHTCSLDDKGKVRCWGWNSQGQLGLGHTRNMGDDEPVSAKNVVDLDEPATAVSTGANHSCALLESGAVRCWGDNRFGQLGYSHTRDVGDDESPSTVAAVYLGAKAVALASGSYHNCAVVEGDRLKCWGYNKFGQLGYGHTDAIGDTETPAGAGPVPILEPDYENHEKEARP